MPERKKGREPFALLRFPPLCFRFGRLWKNSSVEPSVHIEVAAGIRAHAASLMSFGRAQGSFPILSRTALAVPLHRERRHGPGVSGQGETDARPLAHRRPGEIRVRHVLDACHPDAL
jgi:hypothetical protein